MTNFHLKVQRIEQICLFELSWGKGQQVSCTLNYPQSLTNLYQEWQRIYLSFYKSEFRGWLEDSGSIAPPPIDWHARLVQAEAKLLYEFHHWLRSAELFDIRSTIAKSQLDVVSFQERQIVNVFLTCETLELARLPWEAWEIGAEFSNDSGRIRIVRTPKNIRGESDCQITITRRGKARILAILGDETGLNFKSDKAAVLRLKQVAKIEFVGWQPGQSIDELKANICAALIDERGWDVLFFAGHSNETQLTGGELAIAPNISLSISEIKREIKTAKTNGLQFALFNSCSGINIAESLIDLGLSQVLVMREPVHNSVAQTFLLKFLQVLAESKDVCEAMLAACQHLKVENSLTYPSAFLIPSLFCHPDAVLFRIPPAGWKYQIKRIIPTKTEAIAIASLTLLSLSLPVQDFLLERRILAQAVYRQLTRQVPANVPPPALLVQIDEESIRSAKIADPKPMDRKYLAKLVDKLSALNVKIVGIDYLLDRPQGESDRILAKSLQAAVKNKRSPTWFVFASVQDNNSQWLTVLPEIASPNWSLQGYINVSHWYIEQVSQDNSVDFHLPFTYLLALAYRLNFATALHPASNLRGKQTTHKFIAPLPPQPQLNSKTNFLEQLNNYITNNNQHKYQIFSSRTQFQPLTSVAYDLGQMWGQPILDFSIPPDRVYQRIPAWQLLKSPPNSPQLCHLQQQVVIIAPGGYGEAGIFKEGQDNYQLPAAISYWLKSTHQNDRRSFTGGEAHAYMLHHFVKSWLVIPIPDLWASWVAVLLGKTAALNRKKYHPKGWLFLIGGTAIYGLLSLQVYISAAVLLPWFLPSIMVITYTLLGIRKKRNG